MATSRGSQQLLALLIFFLVSTNYLPCSAEDEIGLYFDAEGSINCLPDFNSFPQEISAYLILKNCSSTSGVGGWECAFSLSPGCSLLSLGLGSGAINTAMVPEFIVNLGTPLAQSPLIVIATFTFFFIAPGEIYLHASEQNSVEGEFGPVILESGGLGQLIATDYSFGSPFHPVATIGLSSCPEDTFFQAQVEPEELDWDPVPIEEATGGTWVVAGLNGDQTNKIEAPDDFSRYFDNSDIGLSGNLISVATDAFYNEHKQQVGAAMLTIDVEELFWGPSEIQTIDIWVPHVSIPGRKLYDPYLNFSGIDALTPGAEIVVFASYEDGVFWTNKWRVFFDAPEKVEPIGFESKQKLRKLGYYNGINQQSSRADIIGLFDHHNNDNGSFVLTPIVILLGKELLKEKDLANIIVKARNGYLSPLTPVSNAKQAIPVFCLLKEEDGSFVPVTRRKSVFLLGNDGFVGSRDMPVNIFKMLTKWGRE